MATNDIRRFIHHHVISLHFRHIFLSADKSFQRWIKTLTEKKTNVFYFHRFEENGNN